LGIVTIVDSRVNVWEALAGLAPGTPVGPADTDLWGAVSERLNPARARPVLRADIEIAELISIRDVPYLMLRSPGPHLPRYLRLAPEELRLAQLMDGTRTVARLVAEFAKISGRLAPDQVTRVVADLAGSSMLQELPVDAFHTLDRVRRGPLPRRIGRGLLAAARGRRMVVTGIDPLISLLYRAGGRLLFTRPAGVIAFLVSCCGLAAFCWQWARGAQSLFLVGDSYLLGAVALLGLNVLALASHELGHALAAKHAGRGVPTAGFLVYFGIPSVFIDTSDVWMAGRRARLITTSAGPAAGLVLAGATQLVGLAVPGLAPLAFKLTFAWYLNALFNLNPFLALDGYYLLMDWLEIPNLRTRGLAWVAARLRRRPPRFGDLDAEGRLIALYGMLAVAWLAIAANLGYRIWIDRVSGLVTGLWHTDLPGRLLLVAVITGLASPVVAVAAAGTLRGTGAALRWWRERHDVADLPRRVTALAGSSLGGLPPEILTELAERSRWMFPRTGTQVVFAGAAQPDILVVVDGALEARRPGDPSGAIRERVGAGGLVGLANALTGAPAAMAWHTAGTALLAVPAAAVVAAVGPLPGAASADVAERATLLGESPALAGRTAADLLGLFGVIIAAPILATVQLFGIYILRKLSDRDPFPPEEAPLPERSLRARLRLFVQALRARLKRGPSRPG
jgi:putative peptide zinc metalloprotease protein